MAGLAGRLLIPDRVADRYPAGIKKPAERKCPTPEVCGLSQGERKMLSPSSS